MLVSFPLAFLVIRTIKETNYEDERVCNLHVWSRPLR